MSTLAYVKQRAAGMGAQSIQIYQGNVQDPKEMFPVFSIREGQPAAPQLDEFGKFFSGQYTAYLRTDSNKARASGERIPFFHSGPEPINGVPQGNVLHAPAPDPEAMRAQIRKEMQDELRERELMQRLADLETEIRDSKKPEERLMSITRQLAEHFDWKFLLKSTSTPSTAIQGTDKKVIEPKTDTMAKTTSGQHEIEDITDEQAVQMEEAFATIYSHLGFDMLLKVAKALNEDPSLAKKLSLFIN